MGSRARWNLVDLIVILLVFICLLGAIIRVGGKDWFVGGSDLREYEIYFSVTDIAYTSEDALVIGDTVTLCDSGAVLGELKSIDSILPSTLYVKDADGNVVDLLVQGNQTIVTAISVKTGQKIFRKSFHI